jgi:hypothetical protein
MGGGMGGGRAMAAPSMGGGAGFSRGSFAAAPTGAPAARSFAAAPAGTNFARGGNFAATNVAAPVAGRTWNGGNTAWNGNWHGGRFHHHHGFFPGAAFATGVALGSAYAYGPDYYYDDYAYGPDYTYGTDVAVVPDTGVDASYCAQRYRSWDPASQTYLGYDGQRHPCP